MLSRLLLSALTGSAIVSLVVMLLTGGSLTASGQETPAPVEVNLPSPTGPYSAGRAAFEWIDADRDEVHSADESQKRELLIWVWYPVDTSASTPVVAYMPGQLGVALQAGLGLHSERIHVKALDGGPVAGTTEKFPVLVFSPGSSSLLAVYSALQAEMASHGYIVVGIQHTYNAMVTPFSDGRMIAASPDAVKNDTSSTGPRTRPSWSTPSNG